MLNYFIIIKHCLIVLLMRCHDILTITLVANWQVVQRGTLGVVVDPVVNLRVPDQAIFLL